MKAVFRALLNNDNDTACPYLLSIHIKNNSCLRNAKIVVMMIENRIIIIAHD